MSSLAAHVLPHMAKTHDIYYVTAGREIPQADFVQVIRGTRWRHMNVAGFELSRYVNRLYQQRQIDLAVSWASIGFGLRTVPFINLEGGSVYAQIRLFSLELPWFRRARYLPGLVHFALPEMLCNRRAAKVIVPSDALKRDLMRLHRLPEDRVAVVPHGTEERLMTLYEKKRADLPPRILFVGRLHPAKGIAEVLREFVRRKDIKAEFVIAGDGPHRLGMEKAAAGDERVKMLGQVSPGELERILFTTTIFVFPTFYEGFGLALTEAMTSGHACVCYDIPVVREVLGECGVFVPLGDAVILVEEVARLVNNPEARANLSARAHERSGRFSWDDARESIDRILCDTALSVSPRTSAILPALPR